MLLHYSRYESEQECEGSEECTGTWFASDWGTCSVACGEGKDAGQMLRKVFCISGEGEPVAPDMCEEALKPFEEDKCNDEEDCGKDEDGEGLSLIHI